MTPDEKKREEEEEEEEEEKEREMTPESQRRKELSEMMKMSVEGGLGVIMAQIVEEGRPQQVVVVEGGEKREREEREEENKEKEIAVDEAAEREEVKVEEKEEREMEEGANGEEMEEEVVVAIEPTDQLQVEEKEEKMEEEMREREEQKEQEKEVITVMTLDSSPRPVARATAASHTHQKESSLVTSPVRKTSASFVLWPRREGGDWINLSDQFQSAMDILDSFSAAMDEKFGAEQTATLQNETKTENGTETECTGAKTRSGMGTEKSKKATPTTPDKKKLVKPETQADLVSPDRRKRLVEQAAKRFPFKRAHTFDVGVSHTPSVGHAHPTSLTPSSSPGQSRAKWEGQDLVSKVRKERLMNDALAKMRKKFSQSASSKNTTT